MMYLLLMFMSLLISVEASVSMPTSMPSPINYEALSTKTTIEQHVEEVGAMMLPSTTFAPSLQPTNYKQTTSLLSNPTTMQPLDQLIDDLPLIKLSVMSTRPSHLPTRMTNLSSKKQGGRFNWLFPGSSSGYMHSSCLMSQTQTSCFVPTFHWSKYKTTTIPSLSPKRIQTCNNPMLHPKQTTSITSSLWSNGGNNIDLEDTNKEQQLLLLPLAMYTVIPFIPSAVLSTLNDQYLAVKNKFNLAAASLLPTTPTDSLEYLSAQDIYNESMQKLFVLLLSKRLMLYFLATLATLYAGWRASSGVLAIRNGRFSGPGDHLDKLTEEVLKGKTSFGSTSSEGKDEDEKKSVDDGQLFATLVDDDVSNVSTSLALILPLVLGASLALSYLLTVITPSVEESASNGSFQYLLSSSYIPYLTSLLPSAALCLLFTAAEFRWLLPSRGKQQDSDSSTSTSPLLCAGNVLAFAYVFAAYGANDIHPILNDLNLWPIQNGVNIALGATVARALSPFLLPTSTNSKSIRTVALALIGLTLFDAISTFGTVANAAETITTTQSVMETVARDKLSSGGWQPGLLEVIVGHSSKVTDALGLGDVVFPSSLVAWGLVVDNDSNQPQDNDSEDRLGSNDYSYASSAIGGYVIGSFLTEIVGSFNLLGRGGLPALVFLVPSMLTAVSLMAWSKGDLNEVWGEEVSRD